MTALVDRYLRCPAAVPTDRDPVRGEMSALVDGKFAWGPFLGLSYDQACTFDRDVQREMKSAVDDEKKKALILEVAYYTMSEGKDLLQLFEMWAWARTKQYGTIKLRPNFAQSDMIRRVWEAFIADLPFREYVVKARQWGLSTTIQILFLLLCAHMEDINATTMAHKENKTLEIWRMQADCWKSMPYRPRVQFHPSRRAMAFEKTGSRGRIESAEDRNPAHSDANRLYHQSESARYPKPDEIDEGVSATLPERGFFIWIKESTALGFGDHFHRGWQLAENGKSEFKPTFYGWLGHPEYRRRLVYGEEAAFSLERLDPVERELLALGASLEQLKWWRLIVATKFGGDVTRALRQYPATPLDAFRGAGTSAFSAAGLAAVRKWLHENDSRPKLQGHLLELVPGGNALTRDPLYL